MYKVNLLPPKLQREGIIDTRRLALIAGTMLLAAAFLGGYAAFLINFFLLKSELATTRQQLASLTPVVSRVEKVKNERKQLEDALKEYHSILEKRLVCSDLLFDLNNFTPIDLWLTELEMAARPEEGKTPAAAPKTGGSSPAPPSAAAADNKTAPAPGATSAPGSSKTAGASTPAPKEPEGYARPNQVTLKGFSRTVPSVGVFMYNLYQLPWFQEVKLRSLSAEKDGVKFEITASLKEGS